MTSRLSALMYRGIVRTGAPGILRRTRRGALILAYHNVVADPSRGDRSLHMPVDAFVAQMRWMHDHYACVSLDTLAERLEHGLSVRGMACVTFDDAYTGVFTQALPVLATLGTPATIFVVGNAPGKRRGFWWDHDAIAGQDADARMRRLHALGGDGARVLRDAQVDDSEACRPAEWRAADWPMIRDARRAGFSIGAHGHTHRTLNTLSPPALEREISASAMALRRNLGTVPTAFAYPYGIWNAQVCDMVARAGFRVGVTVEPGLNSAGADLLALKRVCVPAGISLDAFASWTAGLRPPPRPRPRAPTTIG